MKKLLIALLGLTVLGCSPKTGNEDVINDLNSAENKIYANPAIPDWSKNSNIYEVNLRQYTPEGTITAFQKHLPRLQEMGVDILWFMPVHPISEAKRKGPLGSYYAVSDYRAVNPQFGTTEAFRALVNDIHQRGMHIVIDWVPNHTGWDHVWLTDHPEYYTQDENGNVIDPINPETGESWGWTDVADLNYDNMDMRQAMIDDMLYWLEDMEIDGFRVDVAHGVPHDFWQQAIPYLQAANPELFMLAEAEIPALNNDSLYTMSYGWSFHHLLNEVAQEHKTPDQLDEWRKTEGAKWKAGWLMHFITNHDENSWQGTVEERMGPAADAMAVLTFTYDGMPLIYSGQEAGLNKRLEFFEKDPIDWADFSKVPFYTKLLKLKRDNPALWNGIAGGSFNKLPTSQDQAIYAYARAKEENAVIVVLNLSGETQETTIDLGSLAGNYTNVFANSTSVVETQLPVSLKAWDYLVLSK